MNLTPKQWLTGLGSACTTLAAQAVAFGDALPKGMEWVTVAAFTAGAFIAGVYSPKKDGSANNER